ncbi:MAG: hypothetical protein HYV97_06010 [Bdellovibrio sp.]|nr:hypothetical protein [Bdellovibrio sp.]
MRKPILPLLLALAIPFGEALPNGGTHIEGPRKGFHIEPNLPTPKVAGETAVLEGKFCVWHVVGNINKNPKCRKVKDNEFETHAYWPDPFSEVAIDIAKIAGGREFHYSFATSQISASDVNTLTFLIESKGRHHSNVTHLLHFKARLDRRIFHYEQHKDKMMRRGENQEVVAKFSEFIAKLSSVRLKVQSALDARPEVLGRLEMPVQVGNNIAAPFISSTIFDGYRLSLDARAGSLIEGDRAAVTASIYDMSFKDVKMPAFADQDSEDDDELLDDGKKFYYQVILDNNVLFESSPALFPFNSTVSHNFSTQALSPDNFPSLSLKFIKYEEKDDGTIKTTLWGRLDQELFVANDDVAPEWLEPILPDPAIRYAQNFPPIDATAKDSFGKINPDSINLTLKASLIDGTQTTTTLNNLNKVSEDSGRSFRVFGDLNSLPEGEYTLLFEARDLASNLASPVDLSRLIRLDRTTPTILLSLNNNLITNNPNLDLHVSVFDHSPKMTTIFHQDQLRFQSPDSFFDLSGPLFEGLNFIRAESIDAAGNTAAPQTVIVELDTIPPQILNLIPASGAVLNTLAFTVSGFSNEILSQVLVNNQLASLSLDKKSFSLAISATAESAFSYTVGATDLAGNTTTTERSVDVVLRVLNQDLIAVEPQDNYLMIIGAAGAARPNIDVHISAGLFNSKTVRSLADGSFSAQMDVFTSATITATDTLLGRTDAVTVTFNIDTTLAGVVKDIDDNPLPGVTVRIEQSGQSTITDATGTFRISDPMTGDQKLLIDGTTIPPEVVGPNRKFSTVALSVSIGRTQSNVIQRIIYLAPLLFDGTETHIAENSSASVVSPHAPGVELSIPAGVTTFPDGTQSGDINMTIVSSDRTTIPPPEFAVPETVIALEPSGVKFSKPVDLVLPNENEFPSGMDLVILSKNSVTGEWEVDGIAQVSENGNEVVTKPGMGITHFSEVFCVPLGPTIKQIGAQDRPGADTFNGALISSIELPSYKSRGQNIAASLMYKSNWAKPTIVVSNLFDIPRNEVYRDVEGTIKRREYTASYTGSDFSWIQPDYIEANFVTAGIVSGPIRFTGIPYRAVISYAMDLSNLGSGIYPYSTNYKVQLKRMVISTRKVTATANEGYAFAGGSTTLISEKKYQLGYGITEMVFPQDLQGPLYVQNKINSEVGRGWKIAGVQKITNPQAGRIMLEEADGSISTYTVENTIDTLHSDDLGIRATDLSNWPKITYADNQRNIKEVDLSDESPQSTTRSNLPNFVGRRAGVSKQTLYFPTRTRCTYREGTFDFMREPKKLLRFPDNSIVGTDFANLIFKDASGQISTLAGNIASILPQQLGLVFIDTFCWSADFTNLMYGLTGVCNPLAQVQVTTYSGNIQCPLPTTAWGQVPALGYVDGPLVDSKLSKPMGMTYGPGNLIVIADTGNNVVRQINLETNTINTIAGNAQTYDNGNGGPALSASIFHPRGVVHDSLGSLYISTENGYIRKVDTNGVISTIAGKPLSSGGIYADITRAEDVYLQEPFGMTIDNDRGYLYVADTGNHRIVRIDLQNKIAETVAGNGTCVDSGEIGDSKPALQASLCSPVDVGLDSDNNLLITDPTQKRVRRVIFQSTATGSLAYSPVSVDKSTLLRNSDGTFIRTYRNGTKIFFDNEGRQNKAQDRVGNEILIGYDSSGRITSQTDAVGKTITYSYSGDKLETITDPTGRETRFTYTGALLTEVEFPDGNKKNFIYDENGLMLSETDQRGNATQYEYNQWHRLSKVKRADDSEVTIQDSASATVGNNYIGGASGQLKTYGTNDDQAYDGIKDAKNIETKFVKDTNGFIDTIVDGEGKTTKIERNAYGDPIKIIRPDLSEVTFVYDPDTRDLLSRHDSATNASVSSTYNSYGQIISETNASGLTTTRTYDVLTGLLMSATNSAGQSYSFSYYALGLLKEQTNPLNRKISFDYFPDGNLKIQVAPDLSETSFERDSAGNITKITNAKGQMIRREHDSWNRLTAVVSAKNERTEYKYQETGELINIKDPLGKEVNFYYNSLNQMFKKVDQLGHETLMTYDKNGNLETELAPNGNLKSYQYDTMDRLVKKILPDNVYEFDFDSQGNLSMAKNNISQIDFEYEPTEKGYQVATARSRGLGTKSDYPDYELSYSFDQSGNRVGMETAVGSFSYGYDLLDRQTSLTNHKGEIFTFAFDLANRLRELTRPNGKSFFDFDNTNFLTSIVHKKGSTVIKDILYERDSIGNRTKMRTPAGNFVFGYDSNNQLLSSSNPEVTGDFASEIFNYDGIGNRTDDQLGNYLFDLTKQRLTEDYRYYYYYDLNGNLTSKQSKTLGQEVENFIYNSENQLIRFEHYENNVLIKSADYFYNALAQRVEKVIVDHQNATNNLTRRYVYHDNEILHEMDATNQILSTYTHSGLRTDDTLAVDVTSAGTQAGLAIISGTFYFLKDGLGSITEITDSDGDIIQRYTYSAFGKLLSIRDHNNQETSFPVLTPYLTYTNRESDIESGLYYYRARFYDPVTGRFQQADPAPGKLSAPITVGNKYIYTGNNPITRTDPSGKSFWSTIASVAIAVVVTAALPEILIAAVVIAVFDPAMGLSIGAAALNLSAYGQAINLVGTGNLAELHFYEGTPYIKNSVLPEMLGVPAFSLGFMAFIGSDYSDDPEVLMHEYGHTLQYKDWGGWKYMKTGSKNKGDTSGFEQDADRRSTEYFGVPVCDYHDLNHPVPQCRY